MKGQFRNISDKLITVIIGEENDGVTIGQDSTIKFGDEPVVIDYSIDDSFQTIIKKTATINLVTKDYVGADLFSGNAREIGVLVKDEDNKVLFSGFLSPSTFNQPYNNYWDEFTLEAIDYLGTIEYYNYHNSSTKEDYDQNKADSTTVSFLSIIQNILPSGSNIYYDQSKGLDNSSTGTVFSDLSIPEYLFYGEEFDDVWTQEDVLHEILQYLNLHIIQEGEDFYIFDWDSIKPKASINELLNQPGLVQGENFFIMDKEHYDLDRAVEQHMNEMLYLPNLEEGETATVYILTTDCYCGYSGSRYVGVWSEAYFQDVSSRGVRETRSVGNNNILGGINYYALYCPDPHSFYRFEGTGGQRWRVYETHLLEGEWINLLDGTTKGLDNLFNIINNDLFGGSDTSISIDEVYNQISLTCDIDEQETLIENPLDKDNLKSLYKGKQLYLTEYKSVGGNTNSIDPFNDIVLNTGTGDERAKTVNWFMQVMTNPTWKLYTPEGDLVDDLCEQNQSGVYINQWKIPKYLRDHSCTPAILRMGKYEIKGGNITDNSPIGKLDMKDYLFISVNGNENDTEGQQAPNDLTLQSAAPIIEYAGSVGGVFSPPDDDTTNYLVFSGKIIMQTIQYETCQSKYTADRNNNYDSIVQAGGAQKSSHEYASLPSFDGTSRDGNQVKTKDNQMYYTRKFYNQTYVNGNANTHLSVPSLQPWSDDSARGYQYNYTYEDRGSVDRYSKLPILECELTIGNKRLIETDIDEYGNSTFQWVVVGEEPSVVVDGVTYKQTTFSLGVNPKIGDYIIGDEFDIQDTIDYTMNVDASGTAIPITRDNALWGKMTFRILGLVNSTWDDVTRRHKTWFRSVKFSSNAKYVLAHTENVIIKDFQCKIYSNNGLYSGYDDDNEIVYKSAESDAFIEKKDDIEFKISTQLTSKQAVKMGVSSTINLNSVLRSSDNLPLICYENEQTHQIEGGIYNARTGERAKAEEHYIDQYYQEYSTPKTLLDITLHDSGARIYDTYTWGKLGRDFTIRSRSYSPKKEISTFRIKEI